MAGLAGSSGGLEAVADTGSSILVVAVVVVVAGMEVEVAEALVVVARCFGRRACALPRRRPRAGHWNGGDPLRRVDGKSESQ